MSDYLYDNEGDPDPELERLETLLRPLAYAGKLPSLPSRRRVSRGWIAGGVLALAACVLLLAVEPWKPAVVVERESLAPAKASWAISVRNGAATDEGRAITGESKLEVGAWLETGDSSVKVTVADVGSVMLAPHSRVRIVKTAPDHHELQLDRGTLGATINAPPRQFVVITPRAVITDLGCAFEITVDEIGRGRVTVSAGSVEVWDGVLSGQSLPAVAVPAGAECTLTDGGPGVPVFSDAGAAFRAAIARYDSDQSVPPLRALLAAARPRDRMTLAAIVDRTTPGDRALLQTRIAQLDADNGRSPKAHDKPKHTQHHATKTKSTTTKTIATPMNTPAKRVTTPVKKAEPSKLDHDALKGLERSIQ